nr:hypothetical protein [uncultured Agathobaculum sp.]
MELTNKERQAVERALMQGVLDALCAAGVITPEELVRVVGRVLEA